MDIIDAKYSEIVQTHDSEELQEQSDNSFQEIQDTEEIWEVPEDRFCRKMAEDEMIAADILQYYVDPKIARNIDVPNLKPARTNFFGMSKKHDPFRELRLDIPYTSRLVDDHLGYEVLFVIEHKSNPNDFFFLQVYPYMDLSNLDKWKRSGHPTSRKMFRPYIALAVLIYCGIDKPDDVQYYQDMFPDLPEELREFVPQSKIIRANLNNHSYNKLPGRPETRAVVETIKRIHDGTAIEYFGDIIGNFKNITWDDRIIDIIHSICFYTASREPITPEHIQETIQKTIPGKEGEHMAGAMAKTLYDEIYEKGVLSGKSEGRTEGMANVILKLLEKRFGKVPINVQKQIYAKRDLIVLDSLAVQLLDCQTIEEFIELL
ncbi:MAG: Rpn family recombination-promoting nuclease/putative transposase [Planctomycetaceae bacterium]|jgi:hypothetical protein|nr:Rpn family recombination-promoting nuclease/putative transposase [Planctomycetaceae bacterium]